MKIAIFRVLGIANMIAFIWMFVRKVEGSIDWSWWIVLSPLWFPIACWLVGVVFVYFVFSRIK